MCHYLMTIELIYDRMNTLSIKNVIQEKYLCYRYLRYLSLGLREDWKHLGLKKVNGNWVMT